jgi:Cation transporter/ATPase, N-terminus
MVLRSVAGASSYRAKAAQRWHALKGSFVTRLLEVNPLQGLNASNVAARRLSYGPNEIMFLPTLALLKSYNCGARESALTGKNAAVEK